MVQTEHVELWERVPRRLARDRVRTSVIIPTLHEERTLELLLSRFDDATVERYGIELIVSDGGSTDATCEIARRYADVVLRYCGAGRQTIAAGRNAGGAVARGEVLVFLNADCQPADWERFWGTIAEWASGEGCYSRIDALAAPVQVHPQERRWSDAVVLGAFNAYLCCMTSLGFGMGRGECHVVRRWLFEQLGGYAAHLAAGEDFEFLHRARRYTRVAIPRELLIYESPRRYRRWGYRRILLQWFLNWIGAHVLHRSVAREWTPVR